MPLSTDERATTTPNTEDVFRQAKRRMEAYWRTLNLYYQDLRKLKGEATTTKNDNLEETPSPRFKEVYETTQSFIKSYESDTSVRIHACDWPDTETEENEDDFSYMVGVSLRISDIEAMIGWGCQKLFDDI
jgi:hypothetical protein